MFLVVITMLVVVASATLGLVVSARNYHSPYNLSFALFATLLSLWIVANFFGSFHNPSPSTSFLFYADFILAPLLALSFMLFGFQSLKYYHPKISKVGSHIILFMATFLAIILSLAVVAKLVVTPEYSIGVVNTQEGVLYFPYTAVEIVFALAGLTSIIIATISTTKLYKQQTRLILGGVLIGTITVVFSNIVLPNLVEDTNQSAIIAQDSAYFGALIMLISFSYLIIRHRLFDIRAVVARAVAYLLSLGIVAGAISLLILGLSKAVEDTQISEGIQNLIFISVTLLLVLSYPALKKFFDRVTNSLFYRDAYDAERFIGQLNQAVVSDIEIYSLLRKVVSVIEDNLKVTNCSFATVNHNGDVILVNSDPEESQDLTKLDVKLLKGINEHRQLVVTDYLDEQTDTKLKTHLTDMDLGAVVSLVSKKSNEPQQFSKVYMILGLKKSGNPYTSQDVRVLEIISNSLALAIQNALRFEEISRFNITLQEKIDEATRELQRTNEKLRALDEAKDEFISMASHQLRTPLTSVKGYVSMVLEGDTGQIKADQRKLLQQAFDSSQRMVYLIADLLNVSRLRTGKFVIENRQTNLADVVSGEVGQLKETAHNKNIKLTYEKPSKFPAMMLDETKIRQVVMNFLDNAIYYTPSGGEITVSLKKDGDSIEYQVTDTGVGVPKSEQHHLFTKFYRAGNARKMRPDGTGLGLYMAQKVVVAQGGAVIFESEEGKGSTFGFRFPLKTVSAKTAITD